MAAIAPIRNAQPPLPCKVRKLRVAATRAERSIQTDIACMVEKDIHIVARLAGIPLAGCRDADHAN
ncbi:hypothetical protein [Sedimentitalea nanhaiensis]|uniref:hypothetical protein n=1 Tax=Sedimentitalea nanhaiensis TaxID=999627 RepID=UPI0003F69FA7|nr:hypothetical protein [Sedimentitalea nanhaiensis]